MKPVLPSNWIRCRLRMGGPLLFPAAATTAVACVASKSALGKRSHALQWEHTMFGSYIRSIVGLIVCEVRSDHVNVGEASVVSTGHDAELCTRKDFWSGHSQHIVEDIEVRANR